MRFLQIALKKRTLMALPHLSLLLTFSLFSPLQGIRPAQSQSLSFSHSLIQLTSDGVLDRNEYRQLKYESSQTATLSDEERQLSRHFLSFISKHKQFVRISYRFYREGQSQPISLNFYFAPNYTEEEQIPGESWAEVLSHISQNDTLEETREDRFRCGAAALLSARFLLSQDFASGFQRLNLNLQMARPTYREVHLAQEALYRYANTDGNPGLVSAIRYAIYSDGRVANPVSEGEIQRGADLLGLKLLPLIGSTRTTLYQRKEAVQRFWRQYPQGVLLVGVYLNEKSGEITPPNPQNIQNHFILIFRQKNEVYLVNSGVADNGGGKALKLLNSQEQERFIYQTTATLQGTLLAEP